MKKKIVVNVILAMLSMVLVLPLDASVGVVEPTSFKGFSLQTPSETSAPQSYSIVSVPPTEWNKTYGGAKDDKAYSMVKTSDDGYTLAGETASYGVGYSDFWLFRTDSSGNVQWNRTYGGASPDRAYSVVETSDGGYALAGSTGSFGAGSYDFWLVKTDSAGNLQWNRTYGGANTDIAHSLVQTSDGGYAITGDTSSYGAGGYDFWLVKTDSSGNVQWNKTYGGPDTDIAWSMVQTSDGGYAITGDTSSYGVGYSDFWLVKTDSAGNVQWNRTYGGAYTDIAHSLVQTSDGGYAVAGDTKSYDAGYYSFWLVKTDHDGNMMWNKTYGGSNHDIAYSVVQTGDGGYAIAGDTSSYGAGDYDFWLVKTDPAGNVQWNKTYGGSYTDIAWSVIQTSDAGYAIAGYTASQGAGGYDFWLVKVGAEVHDVAVTDVAPSKTIVGQGFTLNVNVTIANQGNYSETFNVTAYANTTTIDTPANITLTSENSTTITFAWNTTDIAYGNYTISANATIVLGETDTTDNSLVDGTVLVTLLSDIRGPSEPDHLPDGQVDIWDFGFIGLAYGKTSADTDWKDYKIADTRGPLGPPDGQVDIWDFGYCGLQYGQSIY